MRKALSITLVLMVAFSASTFARSTDDTNALQRLYQMDVLEPSIQPQGGVFGAALAGTTCFGGTVWDAVDGRWEAGTGATWTFDSGTASGSSSTLGGAPIASGLNGSSYTLLNPFKSPLLHSIMEGWIGFDNSFGLQTEFRRLGTAPAAQWQEKDGATVIPCVGAPYIAGGGSFSFYAGNLTSEGFTDCFADSGGYGDNWNLCIELTTLSKTLGGNVSWSFAYRGDTEPGFDYSYAVVDTSGNDDDVIVQTNTGNVSGSAALSLVPGTSMRSDNGPVHFKYCVSADGAYSDQDGLYATTCGALTVDNVSITGGGMAYGPQGFETNAGGWVLSPASPGQGGEWADIVALADLPATKTPCACRLADSVLVFEDLNLNGHGLYQDNLAASPVIDLDQYALVGTPGKYIEFDGYFELPLLNYIFVQTNVKWYPYVCPQTGGIIESPWTSDGFIRYFGGVPTCVTPDVVPIRVPFGAKVDAAAEEMQIALGALSYCRFFANCTGQTNSTPWFDNAALCVFGTPGAPLIATRTVDFALDAFPQASSLAPSAPGRFDSNNVKGQTSPEPGSALGDTLTVQGGGINPLTGIGGTWVEVVFNVCPGPSQVNATYTAWLTKHTNVTAEVGARSALGTWYAARMDTAEQGGVQTSSPSWMTAYHEAATGSSGALFTGANDNARAGDLDPRGAPRLVNDIFPDDLFTPGTRVNYFYRARYTDSGAWFELPIDGAGYEFSAQEGTSGHFEFEVLPSSIRTSPDTTWNCVLYVDHFDGRGAQQPIEIGLSSVLAGGSNNCENVRWDRYDVEAPSSQQWSVGRPANTQNGATVIHLLAYQGILWSSGNLSAFNMIKEDADQLDPWLTIGTTVGIDTYNKFYYTGDGTAESITQEQAAEPSALVLLNQLCGVALRCKTYRDNTCNTTAVVDLTACVDVDPVGPAGTPAFGRGANLVVGQGNGCPQLRSFDVLNLVGSTRYGATPVRDEQYNTVANPVAVDYASIVLDQSNPGNGATYSTVVEGISVHYRRGKGSSPDFCTSDVSPITGRLSEVFTWLGLTGATNCENPANLVGIPVGQQPVFKTALANFAPNPLFSGATGTIQFTMAKEGKASVDIFDVNGRLVRTVFDGSAKEGVNVIHWNGKDASDRQVASGVYFTRFRAGSEEFAKKMVVVAGNGN